MKAFDLDTLNVDKEIGKFLKLQKEITVDRFSDKGGNGELFFGTHNILQSRVALKFYYVDEQETAHQEAQLLFKIKHENILEVYDAKMICDNYAYFLTPEISSGDLDRFVNSNIVDVFTALSIIKKILAGLTELHREPNRLVHRDLKPANILIAGDQTPLIADFGSVKRIPCDKEVIKGSRHTFIYRPPESIERDEYTFQSDIYQVGIVLYQLLRGYFPYSEREWLNTREKRVHAQFSDNFERQQYFDRTVGRKISKGKLLNYSSLPCYISRDLKSTIKKATHPEITKRYNTASEFIKALHDFQTKAVNWWEENGILYAKKHGHFEYRIIKTKKGKLLVQKRARNDKWRADNGIVGSIDEITKTINSF